MVGHLKDALLLTLDDVQLWVVDGLDGALDQLERLADRAWGAVRLLQDTQVGRATTSGLDDMLSRLEDATAYYLPLPPTLREYWILLLLIIDPESRVRMMLRERHNDWFLCGGSCHGSRLQSVTRGQLFKGRIK